MATVKRIPVYGTYPNCTKEGDFKYFEFPRRDKPPRRGLYRLEQHKFNPEWNSRFVLLINYHISKKTYDIVPMLHSGNHFEPPGGQGGIHGLAFDDYRLRVATSAENNNEVAVYHVPDFKPAFIGEARTHDVFMSCSRDGTIAAWDTRGTPEAVTRMVNQQSVIQSPPLLVREGKNADRMRAILYNPFFEEIVAISLNGRIHTFDAQRGLMQRYTASLPHKLDNVCLSMSEDHMMYGVGSKSNASLIDARCLRAITRIPARHHGCGIRSINVYDSFVSLGTGMGVMMFWDIRAGKYLEATANVGKAITLKTSTGYVAPHADFNAEYTPAVYAHGFDSTGTRLFAAGGPLNVQQKGNYLAVWQ
ncbi:unnamed protein product [Cyprideis torosa]|uniref:DDB1- and CUL4-associated factor 12 beta-propeller domain-containing protein n=1 Tax=Cyprideis torosa TaxID=163714 RepID=A0A7R8ZSF2_9CRUS|nr:unnamed protein product [Cyprideis torosa]CAG0895925.1 unnamed protein product [Cyprideis torosa]